MTRDSWFEQSQVTTKPAFCSGSQLDSSSGERMYAPGRKQNWAPRLKEREEKDWSVPLLMLIMSPRGTRV